MVPKRMTLELNVNNPCDCKCVQLLQLRTLVGENVNWAATAEQLRTENAPVMASLHVH
jgi:hypothetical protein